MAKNASRQVSIFLNGTNVENSVKAIKGEFTKASNELGKMVIGSDQYISKLEEVKKLKGALDTHNAQLKGIKGGLDQAKGGLEKFVGVAAGAFAVSEVIAYGKQLFNLSSQMEAMSKKAAVVFGESLPYITDEAEKNAAAMGLTNAQYISAAANIQDLLVPMGFQRAEAAQISAQLVNLSGALSEWSEAQDTAQDVSKILNNALLGEREELKALGISISQADVDAALLAKGLNKLTGASKQQAEATATLDLIMSKSADAQTAYANNTGGIARQSAEATAKFAEIAEKLGKVLIPVFAKLLSTVNLLADAFSYIVDPMQATVDTNASLADSVRDVQAEFNAEIEVLKQGNFSSKEKAQLIQEINGKYKEYLPNLISEKASIEEITRVQKLANQAFAQKILYVSLQEEITKVTKEAAGAAKAAYEAEKKRVELTQKSIEDNGQYQEGLKAQGQFFEGFRQLNTNIVKEAPAQVEKIKKTYEALAEDLGTTIANITERFGQSNAPDATGGGVPTNQKDIDALKEEADWRKIVADQIRQKPIIQAEVNALIEETTATQNEIGRQRALEALNLQLQDYVANAESKKLIDINYQTEKDAALETIRVSLLTEQQKEIQDLTQHYLSLLALASRYGIDTSALKEQQAKEQAAIEKKYADKTIEEQKAAQEKKIQALQTSFTALGNLIQAGFDLIGDEGSKSIDFQKVVAIAQIAIDTAKAISSLTAASAANPGNAFTFGGAGTAQFVSGLAQILANVAAAKKVLFGAPKVTQKYEGSYLVTGAQDGRSYNAGMIAPPSTGMLPGHPVLFNSNATGRPVLASERGAEYFVSADSLRDPYVANMVRMIDLASSGRRVSQFAEGGANAAPGAAAPGMNTAVFENLTSAVSVLNRILSRGINAVLQDEALIAAQNRFNKINDNTGGYYG